MFDVTIDLTNDVQKWDGMGQDRIVCKKVGVVCSVYTP